MGTGPQREEDGDRPPEGTVPIQEMVTAYQFSNFRAKSCAAKS